MSRMRSRGFRVPMGRRGFGRGGRGVGGGGGRGGRGGRRLGSLKMRLIIFAAMALFAIVGFLRTRGVNPITGQVQYAALNVEEEIVLGLQAAPEMAAKHGGLHPDREAQEQVDIVGARLVAASPAKDGPYTFEFHLLADDRTINAFALPGGQCFITAALYEQLETEGQLAGVLGHEIGHVIERHGAEHLAKGKLTQGLTGAVAAASDDPRAAAAMAQAVGNLLNMKYGRDDELESDGWGVQLTAAAGYDPRGMIRVMEILAAAG
ncbi:MAG: M48 family metalloprotease, partial [Phycisphaerales bacterium]